MAGYYGYSMSNNAYEAHMNGEKPWSQWTKSEIVDIISELNGNLNKELLKKVNKEQLMKVALIRTSWHHTSIVYNMTEFYSVDVDSIEELTNEKLVEMAKVKRKKKDNELYYAYVEYGNWEGTRSHPKLVKIKCWCPIRGNVARVSSRFTKRVNGKHFEILKKVNDLRSVPKEERNRVSYLKEMM